MPMPPHVRKRLAERRAAEKAGPPPTPEPPPQALFPDDPELDGTDGAHPAWWRGEAAGTDLVVKVVTRILDGQDDGRGTMGGALEALRRRLMTVVEEHRNLKAAAEQRGPSLPAQEREPRMRGRGGR